MIAWAALVLLTSGALAATSWLAARLLARLAESPRFDAGPPWQTGLRRGGWVAFAAAATGLGAATGHLMAGAVFLVPAIAVDHLCMRLWGRAAAAREAPAQATAPTVHRDGDAALHDAWHEVLHLGIDATVVAVARARCEGLLRLQRAEPLELTMLDWAVFLRGRVPDLVAACRDAIGTGADETARATLLRQAADTLEAIGLEAERRCEAGRAVAQRRFALERIHALERVSECVSAEQREAWASVSRRRPSGRSDQRSGDGIATGHRVATGPSRGEAHGTGVPDENRLSDATGLG